MVGAIIGKEGKKIKDLTEKTETEWVPCSVVDVFYISLSNLKKTCFLLTQGSKLALICGLFFVKAVFSHLKKNPTILLISATLHPDQNIIQKPHSIDHFRYLKRNLKVLLSLQCWLCDNIWALKSRVQLGSWLFLVLHCLFLVNGIKFLLQEKLWLWPGELGLFGCYAKTRTMLWFQDHRVVLTLKTIWSRKSLFRSF